MNKKIGLAILITILLTPVIALIPQPIKASESGVGIHDDFPHARVVVTWVEDGDTIRISPPVHVQGKYRTVVRLADIDAPGLERPEGVSARNKLIELLANHSGIVYLDIDKSQNAVDEYGRVIAVAYVREDNTTLLNVNKWMVENSYASIADSENDFDPSKWSLRITYEKEKEKLPSITRIELFSGNISYDTEWGIRVATTPDREYLGLAFSEGSPYYALNVIIINKNGEIVRTYRYGEDKYNSNPALSRYANVFRGMLDIAANETGFLVVWSNYTRRVGTTTQYRTILFSYVPVNPSTDPTTPSHIYHANYQYHPTVTRYIHQDGSRWWVVGYSSQSSSLGRYTINLLNSAPSYTGKHVLVQIYSGGPGPRIGVDVMGGLSFDFTTKRFYIVARGYNLGSGSNTLHDMAGIYGGVNSTYGLNVSSPHCIDCRPGDQGPSATTYTGGYSYYNVYPMYTAGLLGGRYVLTVYNESATSLAYGVIDLQQNTPGVVRNSLIGVGFSTTFYPWVASNETHWLVAWNAFGQVNLSVVDVSGSNSGIITLADRGASFVRVAYDSGSGKFVIPYAVNELTLDSARRNLVVAFYNANGGVLEPWVLPVGMDRGIHNTPLNVKVLRGEDGGPGKIAIVALEGGSLVLYLVGSEYPELQNPLPIPEPVWVVIPVIVVTAFFVLRSLKPRKD